MGKEFQKNFKRFYSLAVIMGLTFSVQTLSASENTKLKRNGKSGIQSKMDRGNSAKKGKKDKSKQHGKKSVTYFDVHFPIDTVDYSAVSVDEENMSLGARQLAAQCAQCHGTYGVAVAEWPDLWGPNRRIGGWMKDYQDPAYIDNIMYMHAVTYSTQEVKLMKEYYDKVTYTGGL